MAYSFQTFTVNQVLTAAQMNQVEVNVRDHVHGSASVVNVTALGTLTSNLIFTDATYDIGASGATRPRDMFLSRNATIGGTLDVTGISTLTGGVLMGGADAGAPGGNGSFNCKHTGTSTTKKANVVGRMVTNANGADCSIQFGDGVANNYYCGGYNGNFYAQSNSEGVKLTNGATAWSADSDERLKVMEEFEPIVNALRKVSSLRVGVTRYKRDPKGTRRVVVIANDVQAVLPEAINVDEEGMLSLRYTDLIPLLISAIKEQDAAHRALARMSPTP